MPRPTTLTFRSCVVIGHVTVRLTMAICCKCSIGRPTDTISKGFRCTEAQMYLGHGCDLSRSRDVIGHVIILSRDAVSSSIDSNLLF